MVDRNRRRGTGFTNINKYLQASGTSGLAGAVGQGIKGKALEAEEEVGQVSSGFQKEAEKSRIGEKGGEEEQKVSGVLQKFDEPEFSRDTVSEEDIGTISGFLNAEYKGPMDIQKEQRESLKAQEEALGRFAGHTRTAEGREALLRRFAGGKGYTTGQQKLDTMLLGKGGQTELEEARRRATGVTGRIRDISESAKLRGEQYKTEAEQFAKETEKSFKGIGDELTSQIRSEAEQRLDLFNKIAQLSGADFSDEAAQSELQSSLEGLGLGDYKYMYGAPAQAVQKRDPVTGEYLISESDLAKVRGLEEGLKLDALNRMLGKSPTTGGYQIGTTEDTIDTERLALEQALGTGKTNYESTMTNLDSQVRSNEQQASNIEHFARYASDWDLLQHAMAMGGDELTFILNGMAWTRNWVASHANPYRNNANSLRQQAAETAKSYGVYDYSPGQFGTV